MNSVISSIKWSFLAGIVKKIFSFALFIYIAKIFNRDLIGVYREFAVLIHFFACISMFSLNIFTIVEHKQDVFKKSFIFLISAGIVTGTVVSMSSQLFGYYYKSMVLSELLLWTTPFLLTEILRQSLRSVFQKNMRFKLLSISETINVFFYCIASALIIPFFKNIILFIIIFYTGNLIELIILSYYAIKDKEFPVLYTSLKSVSENIRLFICKITDSIFFIKTNINFLFFSTFSTSINMLMSEFPVLILGIYFLPENIGNYFIAFQIVLIPCGLITQALSQVFTSKFSKLKHSDFIPRLDKFYNIEFKLLIPVFLVYCLLIREFTPVMFGKNNITEINLIILILFLKALMHLIMNPINGFFAVLKKPQIEFMWSLSSILISNLIIYFNRSLSFLTVLTVFICFSAMMSLTFNIIIFKIIRYSIISFLKKLTILFIKISVIGAIWFSTLKYINYFDFNTHISLFIKTFFASLIILTYILILNIRTKGDIILETKKILKGI